MAAKRRKRKDQAPGWAWMLFGLSIGLGVALFVYLKSGAPITLLPERVASRSAAPTATPPAPETPATPLSQARPAETPAEPSRETDPVADSNTAGGGDLGFYDLLRELEVAVPGSERNADRADRAPGAYRIQAGSFRTDAEAESRQARLALLGIESHVEPAIVDNSIWHRVIIGPLTELAEINRILRRLRAERIETLPPQAVSD